ncbi:hypothetical protein M3J09_002862 [Ascochyta lentis]
MSGVKRERTAHLPIPNVSPRALEYVVITIVSAIVIMLCMYASRSS